jgi:AcrR family transcriptional regulator
MREEKQEKIITAALQLFEQQGYHATKVSDIVREAGVAQGTFYLYFKSKEDLFRGIVESCLQEIIETMEKGVPELCGETEIYRMIEGTLRVFAHNKTIFRIIYKHGIASSELRDITAEFYRRMMVIVKSELVRLRSYPEYNDEELEIVAYSKIGMVEAAAYQWFVVKNSGPEVVEKIARVLVNMRLGCPQEGEAAE